MFSSVDPTQTMLGKVVTDTRIIDGLHQDNLDINERDTGFNWSPAHDDLEDTDALLQNVGMEDLDGGFGHEEEPLDGLYDEDADGYALASDEDGLMFGEEDDY